ncbi:hypothetical protein V500_08598 [Pseudogymnoascus sp. VKM F-4518 (FW-2643)]|nr:hypothetical protein V500_08598 [Pseudogymnoascus sp. VKM F-4518 (FW-2643)]
MSSQLLSLAGWTFLPNLVTNGVQSVWYGITIRAGDPKPQPRTPLHTKHRQRIHIAVITTYLLYTIYEAHYTIRQASDYYQDLGISHSATDREIKSRFRRLAALYHPDKVAQTATSTDFFRHLKTAQDTLLNPSARFAYDRFGPSIAGWANSSSIRDYLTIGAVQILQYYGAGAVIFIPAALPTLPAHPDPTQVRPDAIHRAVAARTSASAAGGGEGGDARGAAAEAGGADGAVGGGGGCGGVAADGDGDGAVCGGCGGA